MCSLSKSPTADESNGRILHSPVEVCSIKGVVCATAVLAYSPLNCTYFVIV